MWENIGKNKVKPGSLIFFFYLIEHFNHNLDLKLLSKILSRAPHCICLLPIVHPGDNCFPGKWWTCAHGSIWFITTRPHSFNASWTSFDTHMSIIGPSAVDRGQHRTCDWIAAPYAAHYDAECVLTHFYNSQHELLCNLPYRSSSVGSKQASNPLLSKHITPWVSMTLSNQLYM